jgi:hypothetical protein
VDIYQLVRKHIWTNEDLATAVTLWTVASYLIDQLELFPFLFITSPVRSCGKTQLCRLISRLVKKSFISTDVSPAALYTIIEEQTPSLIVDEAKDFFRLSPDMHRIFNGCYTRETSKVHRKIGREIREFSTWSPKVLSLIGELPSDSESRCVRVDMARKPREVRMPEIDDTPVAEWEEVRRRTLRWIWDNDFRAPQILEGDSDRFADNWRTLIAVADAAGGVWPSRARKAHQVVSESYMEADDTTVLLSRLLDIYQQHGMAKIDGFLTSTQIVDDLNQDQTAPWYKISQQGLAKQLKAFRISPEQHRRGHAGENGGGRGYWFTHLRDKAFPHI